jgi:hypothetical protein
MEFPSQGDMTLFVIAMFTITRLINFVESRRQHSSGRDQPVTYREESS